MRRLSLRNSKEKPRHAGAYFLEQRLVLPDDLHTQLDVTRSA